VKRRLILLLLILSGCQVLNRPDTPATLRAQNDGYLSEATIIAQQLSDKRASVQATAQAAQATIDYTDNINQQLLATVHAVIPPTPHMEVDAVTTDEIASPSQFVDVGVATSVRQSDGCATSLQTSFPTDIPEIYVTARALSVPANTQMTVEWKFSGQVLHQESWMVPNNETNFCLWFNLNAAMAPLSPGPWSVQLFVNGEAIDPEVNFTIGG
jgi:hypothetical protein